MERVVNNVLHSQETVLIPSFCILSIMQALLYCTVKLQIMSGGMDEEVPS